MEKVNEIISIFSHRFKRHDNDMTKFITITAASTFVMYCSYRMISSKHKKKQNSGLKDIPSPNGEYPYFGHMLSLGKSPGKQIQKWHKEVGHIFQLHMGIQTWVMVDDPLLAHKIFVMNGAQTSHRPDSNFALNYYSMGGRYVTKKIPQCNLKLTNFYIL